MSRRSSTAAARTRRVQAPVPPPVIREVAPVSRETAPAISETAIVRVCAAALVVLGSIAYANSLDGVFVIDDIVTIVENPDIRTPWSTPLLRSAWGESSVLGRPVVALTLAANYALHGLDVRGYHLVNIAIHLLCALVVFGLIRRLQPSTLFAFVCASLWMLHPLNSEVVTYISQRTESMMALFYLLTIYASVRAHASPHPRRWQAAAVAATVLGAWSKQSMMTIPLAVLLVDYALFFESLRSALRSRWRFYLAVTAAFWLSVGLTLFVSPSSSAVGFRSGPSPWVYLLNQSVIITQYLALTVWPVKLAADYGYTVPYTLTDVLPQMVFISGLFVLAVVALGYRRRLGLLGLWVFLTLGVTSSVAPIATEVGAERRMYLPLIALVVLAVAGVSWCRQYLIRHHRLTARAAAVVCVAIWAGTAAALGARTAMRNQDYSSELRLAEATFEHWPTAYSEHGLGEQLLLAGRREEAMVHLRNATRGDARAHFTLGRALFRDGRHQESREQLDTFLRLRPDLVEAVEARAILGRLSFMEGQLEQAADQFQQVLSMRPSFLDAHLGLADVFNAQQRYDQAAAHLQAYLKAGGTAPGVWTQYGIALAQAGRTDEAIDTMRHVLDQSSDDHAAHLSLAAMLMTRREVNAAVQHAERAVALKPADPASRDLLGVALAALGKPEQAAMHFREALRLDPTDDTVREHLAQVLGQ